MNTNSEFRPSTAANSEYLRSQLAACHRKHAATIKSPRPPYRTKYMMDGGAFWNGLTSQLVTDSETGCERAHSLNTTLTTMVTVTAARPARARYRAMSAGPFLAIL